MNLYTTFSHTSESEIYIYPTTMITIFPSSKDYYIKYNNVIYNMIRIHIISIFLSKESFSCHCCLLRGQALIL